jgi:CheY-like chemotaxis protein
MTRDIVLAGKHLSVLKALQKAIAACRPGWSVNLLGEDSGLRTGSRIGIAVLIEASEFFENHFRLMEAGCRAVRAICLSPVRRLPWADMGTVASSAFDKQCGKVLPVDLAGILAQVESIPDDPSKDGLASQGGVAETASEAWLVHQRVKTFSHGGKRDISNLLLGPLRMLLSHAPLSPDSIDWTGSPFAEIGETLAHFAKEVIAPGESQGLLAGQLRDAWKPFGSFAEKGDAGVLGQIFTSLRNKKEIAAPGTLMDLLTQIRLLAGGDVDVGHGARTTLPCPPPLSGAGDREGIPIRILVVDDHAAAWRPVLGAVRSLMEEVLGHPVSFEFSIDGRFVTPVSAQGSGPIALGRLLGEYDLVLLDLILPGTTGLELLSEIRARQIHMPVLLWTTATGGRFPAEAAQSNGFLFKKSATIPEMVQALVPWARQGQARRSVSLPNPFFDHVIQTPALRSLALEFTKWCLKLLDSFHALDDSYFKYFNDHGGRHIISLLSTLERVLRPMIFAGSPIFSDNLAAREREVLSLYLAALCHEFGMFPREGERFSRRTGEELFRIRKMHAVRGLILLQDPSRQWPEFRSLMLRVRNDLPDVFAALCLVTGYHSRLLSLKRPRDFCRLTDDARTKIKKLLREDESTCANALRNLRGCLRELLLSRTTRVKRVRRLCAVFRFADAIDVDKTRVPADFLLHNEARSALDDRENLKRQIVHAITIDRGAVGVVANAKWVTRAEMREVLAKYAGQEMEGDIVALMSVRDVWGSEDSRRRLLDIRERLDQMLERFFRDPDVAHTDAIAALVAISVACELLDEYAAIIDSNLQEHIQLGCYTLRCDAASPLSILDPGHLRPAASGSLTLIDERLDLPHQDRCAIEAALNDLLWAAEIEEGHLPSTTVKTLGGGYSGAFTCILSPKGYQPRFCKVDSYKNIATEYRGLKAYAAVFVPPENLLADVRISKFRDRGVFLGALVGDVSGDTGGTAPTLKQSLYEGAVNDGQISYLFRDVLMRCWRPGRLMKWGACYERFLAGDHKYRIPDQLKKWKEAPQGLSNDDGRVRGAPIRDESILAEWQRGPDRWAYLADRVAESQLVAGFRHGDFQTKNVLCRPADSASRKFVVIDTLDCGIGHALDDLGAFWLNLNTSVPDEDPRNAAYDLSTAQKRMVSLVLAAEEGVREQMGLADADFDREYAIARAVHLFRMLSIWPRDFSPGRVEQVAWWAWREVDKALARI